MTDQVDRNGLAQLTTDQSLLQALRPAAQNSISFDRNAKGEPSWEVKLYFEGFDEASTLARIFQVDAAFLAAYPKALPAGSKAA